MLYAEMGDRLVAEQHRKFSPMARIIEPNIVSDAAKVKHDSTFNWTGRETDASNR